MTDSQRAAMQQALDALNHGITKMNMLGCAVECMPLHYANKALREVLNEPEVEPGAFIQKDYKTVPIKPPEDALEVARRAYRNASVYDVAHVWHAIITALPDSPPPLVPLLTDENILWLWNEAYNDTTNTMPFQVFARAIEQAVRQKVGL